MLTYGMAIVFAIFVWWFSTGAVLYLIGMPRSAARWSMGIASAAALAALYTLYVTSSDATPTGALLAFAAALVVWGWHEMSFLTGLVTGPRTTPSPATASGRAGLWEAVETLLYHEVAILLTAIVVFLIVDGGANQVGLWTFVILWVMRISAKLNLYLGVPNITENFLPDHLAYLKSYFCHRPMNLLFPLSVTLSTIATVLLVQAASAAGAGPFEQTAYTLLAVLMALALLEHWLLVVPVPAEALWQWGLASREDRGLRSVATKHADTTKCTSAGSVKPARAAI